MSILRQNLIEQGRSANGLPPLARIHRAKPVQVPLSDASASLSRAAQTCWVCGGSASVTIQQKATPCPACRRESFYAQIEAAGGAK